MLLVPATAIVAALAGPGEKDLPVLEVLLALPVTVVDDLTASRARTVGGLGGDPTVAHAVACVRDRGWAVVTAAAERYRDHAELVEVERLP